jgi:hypothetical protein
MRIPNIFMAYAPRGAGLRCALAYLGAERDIYGWYTGPRADGELAAEFFLIEDFYTNRPTRFSSADTGALHSRWALDEDRRHELARMQEAFAREWLVVPGDARAPAELEAYANAERSYYSPHFERSVLRHLAKRWPLEYRFDAEAPAI